MREKLVGQTIFPYTPKFINNNPNKSLEISEKEVCPRVLEMFKSFIKEEISIYIVGSYFLRIKEKINPTDVDIIIGTSRDNIKSILNKYNIKEIIGKHPHFNVPEDKEHKYLPVDISSLEFKFNIVISDNGNFSELKKMCSVIYELYDRFVVLLDKKCGLIIGASPTGNILEYKLSTKSNEGLFNLLINSKEINKFFHTKSQTYSKKVNRFFIENKLISERILCLYNYKSIVTPLKTHLRYGSAKITSIAWKYNATTRRFTPIDYFEGFKDINNKIVSPIMNTENTLSLSPLKVFRLIYYANSFSYKLGEQVINFLQREHYSPYKLNFKPDPHTLFCYLGKLFCFGSASIAFRFIRAHNLWKLLPSFGSIKISEQDIIFIRESFSELDRHYSSIFTINLSACFTAVLLYLLLRKTLNVIDPKDFIQFSTVLSGKIQNKEYFQPFPTSINYYAALSIIRKVQLFTKGQEVKLCKEAKFVLAQVIIAYLTKTNDLNHALRKTSYYGKLRYVEILLEQNGINVNAISPKTGRTALHFALLSKKVNKKILSLLIRKSAILDLKDNNGKTPELIAKGKNIDLQELRNDHKITSGFEKLGFTT